MSNGTSGTSRALWAAPIVVNVLFGVLGAFPITLVWVFLAEYPLAAMGWTHRDASDNDGVLPWLVLLVVVVGLYLGLWLGANLAVRRLTRLKVPGYWTLSAVVSLIPVAVLAIFPDLWQALERL